MPTWDELYDDERAAPTAPHPFVLRAAERLRAAGARRVLDQGCGGGRHLLWLAEQGFDGVGTDISPRGVKLARRRATEASSSPSLALAEMRSLPFAAATFDAAISIHVLYHGRRAETAAGAGELARVLRPGGMLIATFLSTRTWKYGQGESLEPDTFVQPHGPEAGVPHHYSDEGDVRGLLRDFSIEEASLDEFHDEEGLRHSHWEVVARAER